MPILTLALVVAVVGTGLIALAIGAMVAVRSSSQLNERIDQFVLPSGPQAPAAPESSAQGLAGVRRRFNNVFEILDSDEMRRKLTAANWPITVSEYWFLRGGAALAAFMLGLLILRNLLPAAGLAVLAYLVPGFLLFRGIQGRQRRFQEQLIDTLTLIRGAVAAGYSFQQSLNVVIQEMEPPTSEEFRQVRREVDLGVPLGRALENMAARMESDDFDLVVTVIITNMQVGGNLTTILKVVMETIRERIALFSEMRALTAYAKFAGYLLTLLPFLTVVILAILSPVYWQQLFRPGATRIALIYAVCSILVGNILLRKISQVKV